VASRLPFDERVLEWPLGLSHLVEPVFDSLPDVLFFIKDVQARYVWVNKTLAVLAQQPPTGLSHAIHSR
jgi:hypothetical protein